MPMDLVDSILSQSGANQSFQPPQPNQPGQRDAVDDILQAATNLPNLDLTDGAYASGRLHAAVNAMHGGPVDDMRTHALVQAYKSLYGQRNYTVQGGNADLNNYLQMEAAHNSAVGNFARAGAQGLADVGLNVLGTVAPEYANELGRNTSQTYNPDMTRTSGKLGAMTGNVVGTLPLVLVPGAAVPGFAAQGFGSARRDVAERRHMGQDIGVGQEFGYATTEGVIQGLVAHYLGKAAGGGLARTAEGELTQTVPFQNLIRKLSPDLLKSIQGTDGAVIRPFVQRALLNMGSAAGQNEVAMILSEIAKSSIGIVSDNEPDLVDRILTNTPETLMQGGLQALPFHVAGEVGKPGQYLRGRVEEVPQDHIVDLGKAGGTIKRNVRYAEDNSFNEEAPAPEAPTQTEGRQLPVDARLSQDKDFTDLTAKLQQQAAEQAPQMESGNGRLPNDTNLETGQAEHPLVKQLQKDAPEIRSVAIPESLKADFDILRQHGIEPIAVDGDQRVSGFTHPDHPEAALINAQHPEESIRNVLSHEAGHIFQFLNPDRADALFKTIPESLKRQYRDEYYQRLKQTVGHDKAMDYLAKFGREEVISMAMGDAAQGNEMVKRAFTRDQGLWNSIKDAFARTINRFSGKGRMLNAIADEMRRGLGMTPEQIAASKQVSNRGVSRVRQEAMGYAKEAGLEPGSSKPVRLDEARAKRIADAYEKLKHDPENPKVKASYDAFKNETAKQFRYLQDHGVKMEPWTGEGQPYKNSAELNDDVRDNKHLWFFTGGDMPADHPLAAKTGIVVNGKDLTYNDAFRAVHDYFGHAKEGHQFGPKGEENAWNVHSQMYSHEAQPAMTTETRGQNSWVNFGPKGESNRANPAETVFAEQKAGLLPDEFNPNREGRQVPRNYGDIGHRFEKEDYNTELWWKDEESGELKTSKKSLHVEEPGALRAEFRGRIDHTKKEISVTEGPDENIADPMTEKRMMATAKRLQAKHPEYTVYVSGKGGMVPMEELASGGRYMLLKLGNVRHSEKEPLKGVKEELNENTPANEPKFKTTVEDKISKQVMDSQAPLANMLRAAMARINDPSKLNPMAYVRLMAGFSERRYHQEKHGLRTLQGEEVLDKATGENLNRDYLVKPLVDHAKATKQDVMDVKDHANSIGIAETTVERGNNRIKKEMVAAAKAKLDKIMESLPKAAKKKLAGVAAEEGEALTPDEQLTEANADKELSKIYNKIGKAKRELAKLTGVKGKGGDEEGRAFPAASRTIDKATQKLDLLERLVDATKKGQKLEPSDILTADEIAKIKGKALERPISGIGQHRDGEDGAGAKDLAQAEEFLSSAKKENAWDASQEYLRRYRLWANEHLKMAVDSGVISKESAKAILRSHEKYVNLQKVMEENGAIEPEMSKPGTSTFRKFRGSNRLNDDPLANLLQSTEQVYRRAEENFVKSKIVDTVKQFEDMLQPAEKEAKDTITVLENGEKKFYSVDPEVAKAINGWGQHMPPALWGILSVPGRLKLWGTLIRPMFRWNNFRRDLQNRLLISEESGGIKGIASTLKGFDGEAKELLDVLGGTMSRERDYGTSTKDYHRIVSESLGKLSKEKNTLLALPKKLWDGYQKIGEWSEAFNRVVEFKEALANAKRRGMSDLEAQTYAAWKARDLMDFAVSGEIVKQVNRIMYQPFVNAEIQGFRKLYELMRHNPTLAAQRLALFGLLPAMIPYFWAKSQGADAEKRYKDTPMSQRIMFYQFQIGDYRIMIPKGQTQATACALWEAFLDKHNGDMSTWARAIGDMGIPFTRQVANPQSLLPFAGVQESISNYSWFYDKHIIPPDQEGVALDLRKVDGASGVGKMLSKLAKNAGWEIDPRKIDHVITSDLGSVGMDVTTSSNLMDEKKPLASSALASYADVRLPPGYTSVSVQDAMNNAKRYRDFSSPQYEAMQTYLSQSYKAKTVAERNRLVDQARNAADAANNFYAAHGDELLKAKVASDKIRQAAEEGKAQATPGARSQWARENPDKIRLLRNEQRYDTLSRRISELRKALLRPDLSESSKAMANREISRLYGVIVQMVADATQN